MPSAFVLEFKMKIIKQRVHFPLFLLLLKSHYYAAISKAQLGNLLIWHLHISSPDKIVLNYCKNNLPFLTTHCEASVHWLAKRGDRNCVRLVQYIQQIKAGWIVPNQAKHVCNLNHWCLVQHLSPSTSGFTESMRHHPGWNSDCLINPSLEH